MDTGKVNRDMGKADGKEWASRLQEWAADWSWWLPVEAHLGQEWAAQIGISQLLVARAWAACITGCLCFSCLYNWLPVLGLLV